jgi:Zn-finger nucleic acid-binding protein
MCPGCAKQISLLLQSADEVRLKCPTDENQLDKEVVHGVIIDRCSTCGGVWLDRGELEHMNESVAADVWKTTMAHPF